MLLTAKSKILENVGLTANEEASAVRQELKKAREALVLGKVHADEISERLRKSEEEHCQAQQAQDDLRCLREEFLYFWRLFKPFILLDVRLLALER